MKQPKVVVVCLAFLAVGVGRGVRAQQPAPATVSVFLDCQTFSCDYDHFRREITIVNWVRDRQDADVDILGTSQQTGGGGNEYTFTFIGRREFAGWTDTLRYVSRNTDTDTEVRGGELRTLKLGLVRYVEHTRARARMHIGYGPGAGGLAGGPAHDPWHLWVVTLSGNSDLYGQQGQHFAYLYGSLSANRTARGSKVNLRVSGSYDRSSQALSTGTYVNTTHTYGGSQLIVWSLSPHWSFGLHASQTSSTYYNLRIATRSGPALEYDLYPYDQSTRRQFTIRYYPEVATLEYEEPTIFDQTAQVLPAHQLDVGLKIQQPWGSVDLTAAAFQYLNDLSKHHLTLSGQVQVRLFRGLSLNLNGSIERTKDQIYLSRTGLTDAEILLQRRQLGTNFQYYTFIGLSFHFGSKFANVVNSRMPSTGFDEF